MVQICALASGSNGNCYYVGNREHAVLIDAGISRRQVLERMRKRGLDPSKIMGIFISHEHSDHACGIRVLSQKLSVPVFMTRITYKNSREQHRPDQYHAFTPGESIQVGNLTVHTFSKLHDAAEPCSFVVEYDHTKVGVMTDIGSPCDNVKSHVPDCDAIFLESNYDEKMLWSGPYPQYLKVRVAGQRGHLSNDQAVQLIAEHASERLRYICLSHLSAENNLPQLALESFKDLAHKHRVVLTDRYAAANVIELP
ncbi:MAG: MBL fold metallo-hydrolase [Breznakibacter sp.]